MVGKKRNPVQFLEDISKNTNYVYDILEVTIINTKQKATVRCKTCNDVKQKVVSSLIKGNGCRKCTSKELGKKQAKTQEQFEKEVKEATNGEYTVLGKYKNTSTYIKVRHEECGIEYEVRPDSFLRGSRCVQCTYDSYREKYLLTTEEYSEKVHELSDGEYRVIGEYTGVFNKLKMKHLLCSYEYMVTPHQFNRGRRCPKCNLSKGEKLIDRVLKGVGVEYESQKYFKGFGGYSYDFYLPNVNVLIEYQGVQHYRPVDLFGGEKRFEIQKRNDDIKRKYAKEHGYVLVEIPYTVTTKEEVLSYIDEYI